MRFSFAGAIVPGSGMALGAMPLKAGSVALKDDEIKAAVEYRLATARQAG